MSLEDDAETTVVSSQRMDDDGSTQGDVADTSEFKVVRSASSAPAPAGPAMGNGGQPVYPAPVRTGDGQVAARAHSVGWPVKIIAVAVVIVSLAITVCLMNGMRHDADVIISQQTTEPVPAPKPNAELSLDGLQGEYWSNAKKILESRGADFNGMVVLTDDGKEPLADANWTVSEIRKAADGHLEVELAHETDLAEQLSGVAGQIGGYAKDAWNNLKDGTMGLGNAR